eukprot:170486-Prymnesium_polylepis.1
MTPDWNHPGMLEVSGSREGGGYGGGEGGAGGDHGADGGWQHLGVEIINDDLHKVVGGHAEHVERGESAYQPGAAPAHTSREVGALGAGGAALQLCAGGLCGEHGVAVGAAAHAAEDG